MFTGINICDCPSRVLLIIYVHMNYVCRYLFLRFKDGREFHQINPSQTLINFSKFRCVCFVYQNPDLENRIQRLKNEQANREYAEMTKNVNFQVCIIMYETAHRSKFLTLRKM